MSTALVYSSKVCPYCVKAKEALTNMGISFTEKQVGRDLDKEDLINEVLDLTNGAVKPSTVPQIFIDGEYIGGYDDLVAKYEYKEPEKKPEIEEELDFDGMDL